MQANTSSPAADTPNKHWDEPDIGSGEKSPGQHDTDELIRQIPPLPADATDISPASTQPLPDQTPPAPAR